MTYPVVDVLVIGGGFYGCMLALHLRRSGFDRILIVERERKLLSRASYANQARVHTGYHYPRSFVTAHRSKVGCSRFARDFPFALRSDFVQLYAVARRRSTVTAAQYQRFLRDIGAPFARARPEHQALFDPRTVTAVFETQEYAFDAARLRDFVARELAEASIEVRLDTELTTLVPNGATVLAELDARSAKDTVVARLVLNCAYASLNANVARSGCAVTPLKHEMAEIVLVAVPPELARVGVTVMDGPFFSCMPFPAEGCHSLSHVRYTPHLTVVDRDGAIDPIRLLADASLHSRFELMVADGARYVPCLRRARFLRSLFEVKTVLLHHEIDDGRPVLVRREVLHPKVLSVLGGKIDGVYDAVERLDQILRGPGFP